MSPTPPLEAPTAWEPANAMELLEVRRSCNLALTHRQGFFAGKNKIFQPLALQYSAPSVPDKDFMTLCRYISRNGPIGSTMCISYSPLTLVRARDVELRS